MHSDRVLVAINSKLSNRKLLLKNSQLDNLPLAVLRSPDLWQSMWITNESHAKSSKEWLKSTGFISKRWRGHLNGAIDRWGRARAKCLFKKVNNLLSGMWKLKDDYYVNFRSLWKPCGELKVKIDEQPGARWTLQILCELSDFEQSG